MSIETSTSSPEPSKRRALCTKSYPTHLYRTFEIEDTRSSSSPWSRVLALSGHMQSELHEALHTGMKQALSIILSHYMVYLE